MYGSHYLTLVAMFQYSIRMMNYSLTYVGFHLIIREPFEQQQPIDFNDFITTGGTSFLEKGNLSFRILFNTSS